MQYKKRERRVLYKPHKKNKNRFVPNNFGFGKKMQGYKMHDNA
jgi:hypothetical protein